MKDTAVRRPDGIGQKRDRAAGIRHIVTLRKAAPLPEQLRQTETRRNFSATAPPDSVRNSGKRVVSVRFRADQKRILVVLPDKTGMGVSRHATGGNRIKIRRRENRRNAGRGVFRIFRITAGIIKPQFAGFGRILPVHRPAPFP